MTNTLQLPRNGAVGFVDWLDPDDASLSTMHASELSMASDVESDGNPRSNTREQCLSGGMPWTETLNQQPAMTRWTAKAKGENDGNAKTDEENGKRKSNEPRPTEQQHSNNAEEKNGEPATGPDDEP